MALTLVVGNKNYSSWSLRPWLAMRQAGIAFDEVVIPLYRAESKAALLAHSPAGKVPVLKHDGRTVWDSLAILEYWPRRFPRRGSGPRTPRRGRWRARSQPRCMPGSRPCAPMSMNLREHLPGQGRRSAAVDADIARVTAIWRDCRTRFGDRGPFLFGAFTAADAMHAPVGTRFRTYGVELDPTCRAYADAVLALPAFLEWQAAAQEEPWVITKFSNQAPAASAT